MIKSHLLYQLSYEVIASVPAEVTSEGLEPSTQ